MIKRILFVFSIIVFGTHTKMANGEELIKLTGGFLQAPLFHDKPDGKKIQIAYAKIERPESANKTPIFYLAGGPGNSALGLAKRYKSRGQLPPIMDLVLQQGPIYFIDQRGTGNSEPNMRCNAPEILADFEGGSEADYLSKSKEIANHCKSKFADFEPAMKALNSVENANDLELLRQTINAHKIILFGDSYGTHLSFSYLRYHGAHVERAILSLVEGPDHTFKLPKQFDEAVAQIDAYRDQRGLPKFYPLITEWIETFGEEQKITFDVLSARSLKTEQQSLSLFEFRQFLRTVSRKRDQSFLYDVLYDRDYKRVKRWADSWFKRGRFNGMYFAMDCASGASEQRLQQISEQATNTILGKAINFPFPEVCDYLGLDQLPPDYRSALKSDVPAIFFSGALDYRTPISNAEEVAAHFPNAVMVTDPDGFHNFCNDEECIKQLNDFLTNK